ncbi:hypothetical protein L1887_23364 [Cichorium endivia]|nr:hypothetical protein L1887_23364 [Cichorium endivia]
MKSSVYFPKHSVDYCFSSPSSHIRLWVLRTKDKFYGKNRSSNKMNMILSILIGKSQTRLKMKKGLSFPVKICQKRTRLLASIHPPVKKIPILTVGGFPMSVSTAPPRRA